jgi:ABC-type sugar transport system ATPase subunit
MIRVHNLSLSAGQFALRNVSFEVPTGDYAVLMGRTGSGKTTILEAVCGLRQISAGTIFLGNRDGGREVSVLPPAKRGIGYVPQDRALFQTMTVYENLAFGLEIRNADRQSIESRVKELAELLGIGHLLRRKPQGLSGGESQRVALGRALAIRPDILCLDEPLSALDDDTRLEIYELLKSVKKHEHVTTLHSTHHLGEAIELADLILKLDDGVIRTVQHPKAGEHAPASK